MKKTQRTNLLDKLHLWTVRSLMGITVAGCFVIGMQIYNYVNYVRPVRLEQRRVEKAQEIAMEQSEKEAELLRRQKEAEKLVKY